MPKLGGRVAKAAAALWRPQLHCTGMIIDGVRELWFLSSCTLAKNASTEVSYRPLELIPLGRLILILLLVVGGKVNGNMFNLQVIPPERTLDLFFSWSAFWYLSNPGRFSKSVNLPKVGNRFAFFNIFHQTACIGVTWVACMRIDLGHTAKRIMSYRHLHQPLPLGEQRTSGVARVCVCVCVWRLWCKEKRSRHQRSGSRDRG